MSGTNSPLMGGRVGDGGRRAPQPRNEPNEGAKGWDAGRAAPSAPSTEPAVHTAQHGSSGAGAEKKSSGRSRRSPSRSSAGAEGGKASVWGRVRAALGAVVPRGAQSSAPHRGQLRCSRRSLQTPPAWAVCSAGAARSLGVAAGRHSCPSSAGPHPHVQGCGVGSGRNAPGIRRPAKDELPEVL